MSDFSGDEFRELDETWQRGFRWVEQKLAGRICNLQRQGRWRPAFFFDLERNGEVLPLYFRGDRGHQEGERVADVLAHEANILQVLEANGLPVAHIYGMCPEPYGIVMDRMPGDFNLGKVDDPQQRQRILFHYMELLAQMHAIDPSDFEVRGIERYGDPRQGVLGDFDAWVTQYRKAKRRAEPMIEFAIQWVYRNFPQGRSEVTFVQADSGQFLYEGDRVTAILDMETGYLGDPLADLGGLLCRDLGEPLPGLAEAMRHYENVSGREVDLDIVRFHGVRFNLCTPMVLAHVLAGAQPEMDYAMYQAWSIVWGRATLAGIAELMRVPLPGIEPYELKPSLHGPAYDSLVCMLEGLRADAPKTPGAFYDLDRPYRLALALQRRDALGPEFEAIECAEISAIVGHKVADLASANVALERIVIEAGPERDEELLRYFYRRILREHELHRPALFEYVDRTLQQL